MPRLILDALWRNRWTYLIYGPLQILIWLLFDGRFHGVPIGFMALSMIAAAMIGPLFAAAAMGVRELRHLPVTARDIWRTTWFVATVVPTAMLCTTKVITIALVAAFDGRSALSVEGILLSALFDFVWAGTVLLLFPLLGYAGQAGARHGTVAASLAGAASIAGMLAAVAVPFVVSDALPVRLADVTPATLGVMVAGLAIAIGALALTPVRGPLAGERVRAQTKRGRFLPDGETRTLFIDRLTGISRVLVPHLLTTPAVAIGLGLAFAAYGAISGSGFWWFVPQTPSVFDPHDIGERGLTYFVTLPCLMAVALGIWTPWARLLKVLPLSSTQINTLLLISPFATWTVLWILGWSAYALAYGASDNLRIEFTIGMASISALVHAVMLRVQGGFGTIWVMVALGGLMAPMVKIGLRDEIAYQIAFGIIAASALGMAAFINHRTLTRSTSSSRPYRLPRAPFGAPSMPGAR